MIGFQNCSPSFKEPDTSDPRLATLGEEDPQPEPTPTPSAARFRTGDPVTRAALGDLLTFELRALLDHANYENHPGAKAIAVAGNGLAAVRFATSASDSEIERVAVESCNAISGQSCTLIASGDEFRVDADKLGSASLMLLKSGSASLLASETPMLLNADRDWITGTYLRTNSTSHPFKALALSPSGERYMNFGASQAEANRRVLQVCEYQAAITPCLLYAEGNQRIFDLASWDRVSRLRLFPADVKQADVPFIFDENRGDLTVFFTALESGRITSIAVGVAGSFGASTGQQVEDTNTKAVAECSSVAETCFLYSNLKKVALIWNQLPSRNLPRAVACAVPRASCAAHQERGCAAATRWVFESGQLLKKSCQ